MRQTLLPLLVLISLTLSCCRSNEKCNIASLYTEIIPQPLSLVKGEGCFTIDAHTALICDTEVEKIADYLRTYLPIDGDKAAKEKSIRLTLDKELGEPLIRDG